MTLGEKIQQLRKQQGLTQEALAEKVSVTRQTISKWELDQSAPDLVSIARLCDIFNVTADHLIREDVAGPPQKARRSRLTKKGKRTILAWFSAAALTAICVCLICDYFTAERLSWSVISAAGIGAAWLAACPLLTTERNAGLKTMAVLSAIPIPFLAILALVLNRPLVFTAGACIALAAIAAAWIIYGIFYKFRKRLWLAFGLALLVMIPVPIGIGHIATRLIPGMAHDMTSHIFNSGITLALALACFGMAWLSRQKKEREK